MDGSVSIIRTTIYVVTKFRIPDQVILGVIIGACLGLGFCHIMKFAKREGFIDRESYTAQYIALSLMSIGLTGFLGSDDLLAAFAAGSS